MAEGETRKGKGTYTYLCGVPGDKCSGRMATLNGGLNAKGIREHTSTGDAFKCHRNYLLGKGYTQTGSRSFDPPGGGPGLILTKKCRFGARMRPGKGGRHMPCIRTGGVVY